MRSYVKVEVDTGLGFETKYVDYKDAVHIMDDDIREELHWKLAPCTEQEFFDAYLKKHAEKYDGEDFVDMHCRVYELFEIEAI